MRITTPILTAFLLFAVILNGCGTSESADQSSQNSASDKASSDANVTVVQSSAPDIQGVRHQLSKWVGQQPVVINFWGTWCPPCRREIPDLVRLYDEYYPQGVEIVSLAIRDTPTQVKNYSARAGMNWVMLMAEEDVAREFRLTTSVPTTIFFDRNGVEQARFIGARDYNTFKAAFDKIVSDS